ncbi:MAG: rhodanese-like domain-containing protein [Bullifex sp.]|nr:rhodanese-like domain-containing protein [Bullifex sp.]
MKKLTVLLIIALAMASCTASGYKQVSSDEAARLMAESKGYVILDVRTAEEYRSGHIDGAICIPNETIGKDMPEELPDKNQRIFVYCRSGNRSRQAASKLAALGYTDIIEFGGINSWKGKTVK